jgi:WD40 repeat protein
MDVDVSHDSEREQRVNEIIAAYLAAVEAGQEPRPADWLRRHPDLAPDLASFFNAKAQFEQYAGPFRSPVAPAPLSSVSTATLPVAADITQVDGAFPEAQRRIGDYELLEELGRGGMGIVYKARQTKLNRVVALKMILAGSFAGDAELARFRAEAEAVARLQHPHIVQIYEIGEHEGKPFFSLEFCADGSLDQRLQGKPIAPREAAHLVELLARAIHAAHLQQIVHRDLKPANILLRRKSEEVAPEFRISDFEIRISDFGLAKKLDGAGNTQSGAIMGTPSYMAPEQAAGCTKDIGPATDIYALGAILYECLTGRPPFVAASPVETVLQVLHDEVVPPSHLQSQTPRDLETICLKCLQREPGKRYESAEILAEDLRRFQAGETIQARPAGAVERGWRWCRRKPVVAALTATVALLLLVLAAGGPLVAWREAGLRDAAERSGHDARQAALLEQQAHKETQRRTLGAYENLVRANYNQARSQRAHREGGRADALALLGAAGRLRPQMFDLVCDLGDAGDWRLRVEAFWEEHQGRLNTEAFRWLSTAAFQKIGSLPFGDHAADLTLAPNVHPDFGFPRVAFSPDGALVAHYMPGARGASRIELLDRRREVVLKVIELPGWSELTPGPSLAGKTLVDHPVFAFSADGKQLRAGFVEQKEFKDEKNPLPVWRSTPIIETYAAGTGERLGRVELVVEPAGTPRRVLFSPDLRGALLIRAEGTVLQESADGKQPTSAPEGFQPLRWLLRGDTVFGLYYPAQGQATAALWNVERGTVKPIDSPPHAQIAARIRGLSKVGAIGAVPLWMLRQTAFSPDQRWMTFVTPEDAQRGPALHLVDLETGGVRSKVELGRGTIPVDRFLPHEGFLTFTGDSHFLAMEWQRQLQLYSVPELKPVASAPGISRVVDPKKPQEVAPDCYVTQWGTLPDGMLYAYVTQLLNEFTESRAEMRVVGHVEFWEVSPAAIQLTQLVPSPDWPPVGLSSAAGRYLTFGESLRIVDLDRPGQASLADGFDLRRLPLAAASRGERDKSRRDEPLGSPGLNFDPTGKHFRVSRGGRRLDVYDAATGALLESGPLPQPRDPGPVIGRSKGDRCLLEWDADMLGPLGPQTPLLLDGLAGAATPLVPAASASRLWDQKGGVRIYDTDEKRVTRLLYPFGRLFNVISPDGRYVAGSQSPQRLVRVADGTTVAAFDNEPIVGAPLFTPTGEHVVFFDFRKDATGPEPVGRARIVETATGRVLLEHPLPKAYQPVFAFRADGKQFAFAEVGGSAYLWSVGSDKLAPLDPQWRFAVAPVGMQFTPDGTRLLVWGRIPIGQGAQRSIVEVFDTEKPRRLLSSHDRPWTAARHQLTPAGDRLLVTTQTRNDFGCAVWDLRDGKVLVERPPATVPDANYLSPDGRFAARVLKVGAYEVLDMSTGAVHWQGEGVLLSPRFAEPASPFTPDGKALLVQEGMANGVALWHVANKRRIELPVAAQELLNVSPDGRRFASFAKGRGEGVKICEVESGRLIQTIAPHTGRNVVPGGTVGGQGVTALSFSADGSVVAFQISRQTRLASVETGRVHLDLPPEQHPAAVALPGGVPFSPDLRWAATVNAENTVSLWHTDAPTHAGILEGYARPPRFVRFHPDGRHLLTLDGDAHLVMWEMELRPPGGADAPASVAATVRWQVDAGKEVRCVAIAPHGNAFVTGHVDGRVSRWRCDDGGLLDSFALSGSPGTISQLAYRDDGRRLAVAASDGVLRVHDPDSGEQVAAWPADQGALRAVVFQPKTALLVTAGRDVRLWNADRRQLLLTLERHVRPIHDASIDADGRRLITVSEDNVAFVWDLDQIAQALRREGLGW